MARPLTHKEYLTLRNTARILREVPELLTAEQLRRVEQYEKAVAEYQRTHQEYFCSTCGSAGTVEHEEHADVFTVVRLIEDDHRRESHACPQDVRGIRVRNPEMCSDQEWAQIISGGIVA